MSEKRRFKKQPLGVTRMNASNSATRTYYLPPSSIRYVWHARWVPAWVDEFRAVKWPSLEHPADERLIEILRESVRSESWYVHAERDEDEVLGFLSDLHQLAQSIHGLGLLHPVTLNPVPGTETYELIAGQRRLLASVYAGEEEIRASVYKRRLSWDHFLRIQDEENWQWGLEGGS